MITIFCSCGGHKNPALSPVSETDDCSLTECKIIKIDNFKNYYLIYAKGIKNNIGYKIISPIKPIVPSTTSKTNNANLPKVMVGNTYRFKLTWISEPAKENRVMNYLDLERCIIRHPFVEICTEAGFELYEANNLQGLELHKG
ncbi:hypothetical protein SGQ83_09060 [Flavobacterium sp. Fl-318]|uniref:Uncharacterized protein n=1 Tax=Flavobacterium cupriresistens TaxID=2893885 RepID=A0ABU4RDJ4_9FLAO|nr:MULTISPECIES: hypothetical protein [unclassified Flavobacterium]MDX6189495.1 hypothetical protein [Flavobacterium sp. Fl-318]UFH41096.1 hypothetical protein LNP23_14895 [Flavobacterium sp. F-323]